jgi:UDP-N-acetylmuramoyl-tripeptide--D-alanyl-D-alanine ligase
MSALWGEAELEAAIRASPSAPIRRPASGVSIDTRTLNPGDLFVAIKGEASDGHDYVSRAFERGAPAAVVDAARAPEVAAFGPVFPVDGTVEAMERLGAAARARSKARIVAVTGSVGKTSAKEMLRAMLSACGAAHASAASYNNHWGVPLSLARMPAEADFGVFEIGMNHAGEIGPLVRLVRPHAALITTIAPVHIEHLGSIEAIADAKAEIFEGLEPGGAAVLNRNAPQYERLEAAAKARAARVLTFGSSDASDAALVSLDEADGGSRVTARLFGRAIRFEIGAPGAHMAENALGCLLVAHALGADVETAATALVGFKPQKGRGERIALAAAGGSVTLIDESYNANPASMRAALRLLGEARPGPSGRRIAVIGDMLELGAEGAAMHAALAADLAAAKVDLLFGAGPLTRALFEAAPERIRGSWGQTSSEIEGAVAAALRAGDVAMVKGSNASRMGPLVEALRQRFPLTSAGGEALRC